MRERMSVSDHGVACHQCGLPIDGVGIIWRLYNAVLGCYVQAYFHPACSPHQEEEEV